jgi:uncharacterized membrane protein YeaQ/YmgE (transglycosylase-associated protein family)
MDDWEDQSFADWFSGFFKPGPGALPVLPVLVGCLALTAWIAFGMHVLAEVIGAQTTQSGQFIQFLADPLAALVGGWLLVYLLKSPSTRGGQLIGVISLLVGTFFTTFLSGAFPTITPLWIFQVLLTFLAGWFGGLLASGQFQRHLSRPTRLAKKHPPVINKNNSRYRELLGMVMGNRETADSLIAYEYKKHPSHNGDQLIQDAIDSLRRDRNRD